MWVLIMGALWETIAFILHSLGTRDQQKVGYATVWQILFLLAPLWINASVYMTFARMTWFFLPDQKIGGIKPRSIAKYFVWADVLTFLVQAAGGVLTSPDTSSDIVMIGIDIYMAGMGLQQFFILLFLALMVTFHHRALATPPQAFSETGENRQGWKTLLITLYVVLALITVSNADEPSTIFPVLTNSRLEMGTGLRNSLVESRLQIRFRSMKHTHTRSTASQ